MERASGLEADGFDRWVGRRGLSDSGSSIMTVYNPGPNSRVFRFSSCLRQREGMVCPWIGVLCLSGSKGLISREGRFMEIRLRTLTPLWTGGVEGTEGIVAHSLLVS